MYAPTLTVVCMDGSEAVFNNCQFATDSEVLQDGEGNWVRTVLGELIVQQTLTAPDGKPVSVTSVFQQSSYTEYRVSVL